MSNRENKVVEVSISNFCNFHCDYCISGSTRKDIPTNPDGSARIFKDLMYNERGIVDHRRVRKYNLTIRGGAGNTCNYGIENTDGTITKDGDHVLENDFINYEKLLSFLRNTLPSWIVQLGGGEPLHNPLILPFIHELAKTHRIILLTNLSLIKDNLSLLDIPNEQLFFRVGFHPEQRNIETYYENLKILKDTNRKYIVNYMLHPRHEENGMAKAYTDFLKDNEFNYEVTRFHGKWKDIEYPTKEFTPMELELLSPHSISNSFVSDPNIPGTSYLSIYPDGKIYQCSKKIANLGSIYSGFTPSYRQKMDNCFDGGNKCQSVISQENLLINHWN